MACAEIAGGCAATAYALQLLAACCECISICHSSSVITACTQIARETNEGMLQGHAHPVKMQTELLRVGEQASLASKRLSDGRVQH